MYKVIYQKKAGYPVKAFTTATLDVESIERMMYWYYKVKVLKGDKVILDYIYD
jgi:hypothetical protein